MVPSPFLEELTPLRQAGLHQPGDREDIGHPVQLEDRGEPAAFPNWQRRSVLQEEYTDIEEILNADIEGMSGIRSALDLQACRTVLRSHTPSQKREFWVTELDDYLKCPYDYYVKHVLGIEPLEEVTEDISPLDRGSKVHAILRNFYLSWNRPVTPRTRDEARALLQKACGLCL